jgi:Domain of unknown function (DUF5011)
VLPILPDLVSQGPDGYYTLNYAGFTPYLVKAVQEIASISGAFEANLIAWLGNASNGIHDLYVSVIHSTEVHTKNLCVQKSDSTEVCITGDQLALVLANSSTQQTVQIGAPTPPIISGTSTPPSITINGSNPAVIHTGDSYADLGATITGPTADLNLGIKTILNGTLVSNIIIDTSTVATDTIDYVATDGAGLTSTSTRQVIIQAANDNQASSRLSAANDNPPPGAATSTNATSAAQ